MQLEAQRVRPPRLDYATYSGPVSIRSAGSRGRGLFTTAAVKAGDLLLCEKAFAYGYFDEKHHGGEMSLLINPVTNVMTVGKQTELIGLMVQKMHANPSLLPVIADLYHGSYDAVDTTLVDGAPVVDT